MYITSNTKVKGKIYSGGRLVNVLNADGLFGVSIRDIDDCGLTVSDIAVGKVPVEGALILAQHLRDLADKLDHGLLLDAGIEPAFEPATD